MIWYCFAPIDAHCIAVCWSFWNILLFRSDRAETSISISIYRLASNFIVWLWQSCFWLWWSLWHGLLLSFPASGVCYSNQLRVHFVRWRKKHELNLRSANVVEWFFEMEDWFVEIRTLFLTYVSMYVCTVSIALYYLTSVFFYLVFGVVCSPIATTQKTSALMYTYFGVNMWYLKNDCSISKMIALVEWSFVFSLLHSVFFIGN